LLAIPTGARAPYRGRWCGVRWPLIAIAVAATGCRTVPATQVIVVVHADEATAAAGSALRVEVAREDGTIVLSRIDPLVTGAAGLLARVPLVPTGGDASRRFRIGAALLDASGATVIEVGAALGYVEHERRELHLWLDGECIGRPPCGAGRTCERGICVGECFAAGEPDVDLRSRARCGECEVCSGGACVARASGAACGCEGDHCEAGSCVAAMPVRAAFGGDLHTCAIAGDVLFCWGSDRTGQTAVGSSDVPVRLAGRGWRVGSAGRDFSCALGIGGERLCWGWNDQGMIGAGSIESAPIAPTERDAPSLIAIDSGWSHSCALGLDGALYCWGGNAWGELGPELGEPTPLPTPFAPEQRFVQIASGGFHDCAIDVSGRLFCWGLNESGELGLGDFDNRTAPVESGCIDGVCRDDWETVGAGDFHTCAIRGGGQMWCWGGSVNGQLGIGPTLLGGIADPSGPLEGGPYAIVAGGEAHTCAIDVEGGLWCWGRNELGQIGNGTTEQITTPLAIALPGSVRLRSLALGRNHSCVVRTDATLWCWGLNADGQVGIGAAARGVQRVLSPHRVCFPPE
jgi:alpha-tubulin suppressor-like RCC1 family protein